VFLFGPGGSSAVTPLTLSSPTKASLFRTTYWNYWARAEHMQWRNRGCVNGTATWAGDVEGPVTPQSVLVMSNPPGARFDGRIDGQGTLTGWFTARCTYRLIWQKKRK
jgi:hypothetical protein